MNRFSLSAALKPGLLVLGCLLASGCPNSPPTNDDAGNQPPDSGEGGGGGQAGGGQAGGQADATAPVTTASPLHGSYAATQSVTLSCNDAAGSGCAATRYTTDGSTPTASSALYSTPIPISQTGALKFFSVDVAGNSEAIRSELYVIDTLAPVTTVSPPAGTYHPPLSVSLVCNDGTGTGCAAIHYTTDGSTPTLSSPSYTTPIVISVSSTVRFFGVDNVGNAEAVQTAAYVINTALPQTTATPTGGSFTSSQTVTLTCSAGTSGSCAATYFTLDGNAPTTSSPQYSAPIAIAATTTLKFFSTSSLGDVEPVRTESYLIDPLAPVTTPFPGGGTYSSGQFVTLICADSGGSGCLATHFTLDGSTPGPSSSQYSAPIAIGANATLKFFSLDRAGNSETVKTATYVIDGAPPVTTAAPAGGLFKAAQSVVLTCSDGTGTGCAATYYTVNGSTPTTSSSVYGAPILVLADTTLKFFSTDNAANAEAVKTLSYVIDAVAPTTTASPGGGTYGAAQAVTLSCADGSGSGCSQTYYTTNGATPTTASAVFSGPINVSSNTTLKFFSVDLAGNAEAVKTETYVVDTTAPTVAASPPAGAYPTTQSVTLSCSDGSGSGCAVIYYTTDGSTPDTGSMPYSFMLSISGPTTVKAIAVDNANNTSAVATFTYVIDPYAPTTTATPGAGLYNASQAVTLSCDDGAGSSGCAHTYYTTNGTTPTAASAQYSAPITISATTTLKFYSVDGAGNAEAVQTKVYTIDTTPPTVTLVTPSNNSIRQPIGSAVWVYFSEAMDSASFNSTTLPIGGGVPGTYLYDSINKRVSFTPSSAWPYNTVIAVQVTAGVKDLAGNGVAPAFTSSFTTETITAQVSGSGSPTLSSPQTAFNAAGDGVSIWSASTGTGVKVMYATYTASTDSWSSEHVVYSLATLSTGSYRGTVTSNGTTFMLAWAENNKLSAALYSGGSLGPTASLFTTATPGSFALASNGTTYMATWTALDNGAVSSAFASRYSTGSWSAAVRLESDVTNSPGKVALASDGTNYLAAFRQGSRLYQTAYTGSWAAPTAIDPNLGAMLDPAIASNGSGYAVAWVTVGNAAYAAVSAGSSFAPATLIDAAVSFSTSVDLTSNGLTYALGFIRTELGTANAYATVYSLGSWGAAASLESSSDPSVAVDMDSNGSEYAAVVTTRQPSGAALGNVWATASASGAWSSAVAVDTSSGNAGDARLNRRLSAWRLSWTEDATTRHQLFSRPYDGSTLGTPQGLYSGTLPGSSFTPRLAANGTGTTLAVWSQTHRGTTAVFGSLLQSGTWTAPVELGLGANPDVASDGAGFMVVYQTTLGTRDIVARRYSGGAFGAEEAVENSATDCIEPRVAFGNGAYAAAFLERSGSTYGVSGNVYSGGAWGASHTQILTGSGFANSAIHLVSNGTDFMVTFIHSPVVGQVWFARLTRAASVWSWSSANGIGSSGDVTAHDLATTAASYTSLYVDSPLNARSFTGGAWGPEQSLAAGPSTSPAIAASSSMAMATFVYGANAYGIDWLVNNSWGLTKTIATPVTATWVASDGTDYRAVFDNLLMSDYSSGAWGPTRPAMSLAKPANEVVLGYDGARYLLGVTSADAAEATVRRLYLRRDF